MICNCNAVDCGPGAGHESYCGQPEYLFECGHCEANDCAECEERQTPGWSCCCGDLGPDEQLIAEEQLRARDYESWANL